MSALDADKGTDDDGRHSSGLVDQSDRAGLQVYSRRQVRRYNPATQSQSNYHFNRVLLFLRYCYLPNVLETLAQS